MCYTELCDQRGGRFVSLELSDFAHLHDAYLCRTIPTLPVGMGRCRQPEPVRAVFNYCLAMVEAGLARLVETQPGEAGTICVFPQRGPAGESSAGARFSLARPSMSEEMEERVVEAVREILEEEGEVNDLG